MVQLGGRDVGSSLIGQDIEGPQWFHPRPSAVRYDAMASGGSNLGPSSSALADEIARRRARIAKQNGVPPSEVPPDALTASGSGLDPDISPAYAELQVARVARARGMSVVEVRRLVAEHTQGRILGFLGEPRVDVLELDLALAAISRTARVTR
jgi:K+-transporting ATPase ATPase C chain